MRAISLWQPWASAIALGSKAIETRHWSTSYRGPLCIHAAKRFVAREMAELLTRNYWRSALHLSPGEALSLPFGALLATCDLTDCIPTERLDRGVLREVLGPWCEEQMGDFSPGRFAWMLENVKSLETPIPWRGRQGFFQVPDQLLRRPLETP